LQTRPGLTFAQGLNKVPMLRYHSVRFQIFERRKRPKLVTNVSEWFLGCKILQRASLTGYNSSRKNSHKKNSDNYYDDDELSFGGGKNIRPRDPEQIIFDSLSQDLDSWNVQRLEKKKVSSKMQLNGLNNGEEAQPVGGYNSFHVMEPTTNNVHIQDSVTNVDSHSNIPLDSKHPFSKLYVLDTNVILHDSSCIYKFGAADICIPIIVLEELDKFKRGNDELNRHAREFLRILDDLASRNPEMNFSAMTSFKWNNSTKSGLSTNQETEEEKEGFSNEKHVYQDYTCVDCLSPEGFSLGESLGKIHIGIAPRSPVIESRFFYDSPDHRILGLVHQLARDRAIAATKAHFGDSIDLNDTSISLIERGIIPNLTSHDKLNRDVCAMFLMAWQETVLVTKDTNLRMKARALGLQTEDYVTDRIMTNLKDLYCGKRVIENIPCDIISSFYESPYCVSKEVLENFVSNPIVNENFILRNGSKSALACYTYHALCGTFMYHRVEKKSACRILPRNAEQAFALHALLDKKILLVTISGNPGTGKTLLALAAALEQHRDYSQIYLSRPIVPLSNRDIGYLPGSVDSKIEPYMQPLFDNLGVIKSFNSNKEDCKASSGPSSMKELLQVIETEKLKITPLTFIRGRSFYNSFFIVDEAQNLTPHEVKTIITRAGEGTKVVFTGDIHQIDNPYVDVRSNGLSYLIERMKGQPLFAHISLEKGERSELSRIASDLL
jgi:PhoH-like ATPase